MRAVKTVGYVGSNHPEATWHELGTTHIPPRPFIITAAMGKEREIREMMGRLVFGAMMYGGPEYRMFKESAAFTARGGAQGNGNGGRTGR
jgi:hypothetical protein